MQLTYYLIEPNTLINGSYTISLQKLQKLQLAALELVDRVYGQLEQMIFLV